MFTKKSAPHSTRPVLSGLAKAAITRKLVPILADLWEEKHTAASIKDRHILGALRNLEKFYESYDCDDYMLSRAQRRALQGATDNFLLHYRWLHANSPSHRWVEIPKHHILQHVAAQAQLQNPRWSWCYIDEDFMGLVKDLCGSCLSGAPAFKAMPKFVGKWTAGYFARVVRQEQE